MYTISNFTGILWQNRLFFHHFSTVFPRSFQQGFPQKTAEFFHFPTPPHEKSFHIIYIFRIFLCITIIRNRIFNQCKRCRFFISLEIYEGLPWMAVLKCMIKYYSMKWVFLFILFKALTKALTDAKMISSWVPTPQNSLPNLSSMQT